jgi:sialate O-acetylesterase
MKKYYLFLIGLMFTSSLMAAPRLPKIFGDNMVLQRNQPIAVWGWADAKEKISVQFDKQLKIVRADKNGRWMMRMDAETAGGPYQMTITGKNTVVIKNILVGEVWVCSGQSNMEFQVNQVINAASEIEQARYPEIRQFLVPKTISTTPVDDLPGGDWKECSPETVANFTAVGYFFARELHNRLHIPIGLINTSWGGTHSETWTSKAAFEQSDEFKNMISSMRSMNLDSLSKVRKEIAMKNIEALQGPYINRNNGVEWAAFSFDDSRWPHMKLPGLWEQQGLGLEDLDGIVWFRRVITVSEEDAGKEAVLELGKVDDSDDTYVNGTRVGGMKNQYNENRRYIIPKGILKAGKNVISVRVEDTGGGGGIYGQPAQMKLTIGDNVQFLAGDWSFRIDKIFESSATGIGPNSYPTLLFNAMINPLIPYAFRGVIWYQGEANAGRAWQYRKAFPLMITDWRQHWGDGDFPFYFVQLSSFNAGNGNSEHGSTWAELREAQTMTLSLPSTGMAVTTDIGVSNDIHPKNKQDVGKRLAAIALNNVYGQTMEYSGPVYQSMRKDGNKIILSYTHTGSGLWTKDKYGYVRGFEVAGADRKFYYAKAFLEGDHIVVFQDGINEPEAVHYAWADDALEANLFNKEGFPAVPFRTDQWKGITEEGKFTIPQ